MLFRPGLYFVSYCSGGGTGGFSLCTLKGELPPSEGKQTKLPLLYLRTLYSQDGNDYNFSI